MAKTTPMEFLRQVRNETNKVTWPTRRETMITALMVVIFTIAMAIFFSITDAVLIRVVSFIVNLGR
ncbi:preprotein translocase subunit SecE [Labrys portucalensis]|uniref:Protein translocase subunit SecE n=1 Tax=Labrys neptuniae TaxID=376174 RepID=A0ABV3PT35_9HYPH|nr:MULTISPECIES: preprotein translocase subunit SecE [Labrys]MDT3377082.1 preprotein translocase subunit SecE [Labrys neptuniae]MDZ5448044.1 preprotein translocase subunit SecE [Labrys sp. ZIDIC5]OCC01007.1 preprotein translocase subunit SecE [Labrys sp. WJW]QEN90516.1 preprotein translocase subunit SecE [Labrys sp. KNU-23]